MINIQQLNIVKANKPILYIDSLQLPAQGAIALIGPNGSGKSTLLKSLVGIQPLNPSAQLLLNQQSFASYSHHQRAQLLGYIPQSFNPCWNQTVTELMRLANQRSPVSMHSINSIYQEFELTTLLTHHWDTLSGGEKARVLAAMAYLGTPPILIADEPGAALDIKHRLQLIKQLVTYGEQQLAIICLHELDLVFRYFEQVILLNKGQLVFFGKTQDLLNNPLLDKTFNVQFKRIKQRNMTLLYPEL